ncbi:fibrinogen C domain-containing protein 1 [Culex quinquefasciatus]|uniref:fibrinogen C domain-containing protein 1 n=1 Tax=Culex quinquefasciatus TaxID=7176 RepID=UPI0018E357EF|nr:fibrinogen C domain-containing protein 1 [Culex quinquefasciatus]
MKTWVILVLCGAALIGTVSCKRKIQCRLLQTGGPESATTTPAPVVQKAINSSEFEMIMAKLDAVDLRILKTEFAVQNTVQGIASDVENLSRVVEKLAWVASQSEQSSSFVEHHVKLLEHNLTRLQKDVREVLSLQQKLPSKGYIDNALVKLKLQTKLEQDPVNEGKIQQMSEMIEMMFKQEQAALHNMAMLHLPKDDTYEYCDQIPRNKSSGVFLLHPDKDFHDPIKVFCNQTFNGGGWSVIQRRFNGTVNFYRDYQSYQRGFGKLGGGEFWLGLDRIHRLTYSAPHELIVILEDWDGITKYAKYQNFEVSGEKELYKVTKIDGYSGTAGDSLNYTKNAAFSTFDHDNDTSTKQNCAVKYHGAWWYKSCHSSNLNGKYLRGINSEFGVGMNWDTFRGMNYALKESTIMIRRRMDLVSEVALRLVPQVNGGNGGKSSLPEQDQNTSQEEHEEIEVEHDQEEQRLVDGGVANDDDYEVEVEDVVSEPALAAQRDIALKEALSVRTL